jgi:hypothetical protein
MIFPKWFIKSMLHMAEITVAILIVALANYLFGLSVSQLEMFISIVVLSGIFKAFRANEKSPIADYVNGT